MLKKKKKKYKVEVTSALYFQYTNMTHQFLFCSRFRHRQFNIRKQTLWPIPLCSTIYLPTHATHSFTETNLIISTSAALSLTDSNEKERSIAEKEF